MYEFRVAAVLAANLAVFAISIFLMPHSQFMFDLRPLVFFTFAYVALFFLYPQRNTIPPFFGIVGIYASFTIINIMQYFDSSSAILSNLYLPLVSIAYGLFFVSFLIKPAEILLSEPEEDEEERDPMLFDEDEDSSRPDSVFFAKYIGGNVAALVLAGFLAFQTNSVGMLFKPQILIIVFAPVLLTGLIMLDIKALLKTAQFYLLTIGTIIILLSMTVFSISRVANSGNEGFAFGAALCGLILPTYAYIFLVRPLLIAYGEKPNRPLEYLSFTFIPLACGVILLTLRSII